MRPVTVRSIHYLLLPAIAAATATPGLARDVSHREVIQVESPSLQDSTGRLRISIAGLTEEMANAGTVVVTADGERNLNVEPVRRRVPFAGRLEVTLPAGQYLVDYTPPQGLGVIERTLSGAVTAGGVADLEFQLVAPGTETTRTPIAVDPASPPDSVEANEVTGTDSARGPADRVVTDSAPTNPPPPAIAPATPRADTTPPAVPEPVVETGYAEILIYTGRSGDQIFVGSDLRATTPDIVIVPAGLVRFRVIGPTGNLPVCEWRTEVVKEEFRCFRCDPETGRIGRCPPP